MSKNLIARSFSVLLRKFGRQRRMVIKSASRPRPLRPCLEVLEDRLVPSTFVVTEATDNVNNSNDTHSLRGAINALSAGDTIQFQVKQVNVTHALPAILVPVTIQGNGVTINGSGAGKKTNGLVFDANNNSVTGVTIGGFGGVQLAFFSGSSSNTIQNNQIGTNAAGTEAGGGGGIGLEITGANNSISGNTISDLKDPQGAALYIVGGNATGNTVTGNFIGTDHFGLGPIGNAGSGVIIYGGAYQNTLSQNVISANAIDGVDIGGTGTSLNTLCGNFIGTSKSGSAALGNHRDGVEIYGGASGNTIGGAIASAGGANGGNVISNNGANGVDIFDSDVSQTSSNVVEGNLIGTDLGGTHPLGNRANGVEVVNGAIYNTVGSTQSGYGNVISGNGQNGILVGFDAQPGVLPPATRTTIVGNSIGADINGQVRGQGGKNLLHNGLNGVEINAGSADAPDTIGGTTTGAANLIAGNGANGIAVTYSGRGAYGGTANVLGNLIGTDSSGDLNIGNGANGIFLDSTTGSTIGGTSAAARNVISGNSTNGIQISGPQNQVLGNYIGVGPDGSGGVPNHEGILIIHGTGNQVGSSQSGAGNQIGFNQHNGIHIVNTGGANSSANSINGNWIGTDPNLDNQANGGNGILIQHSDNVLIGTTSLGNGTAAPNTVAFNGVNGLEILGTQGYESFAVVQHNVFEKNSGAGILLNGARNDTIGAFNANDPGDGNLIHDNTGPGIHLTAGASGQSLLANQIYDNQAVHELVIDHGCNSNVPAPSLTGATWDVGLHVTVSLTGKAGFKPNTTYLLQFFGDSTIEQNGSARFYLGSVTVTTDKTGPWRVSLPFHGDVNNISATASTILGSGGTYTTSTFADSDRPSFFTPNNISGAANGDVQGWVGAGATVSYGIAFENAPGASAAPVKAATITTTLDANLDWSTFQLGTIQFGSTVIAVPAGQQSYSTSVNITGTDGNPLQVNISASLDTQSGAVTWTFQSIDPNTGQPPTAAGAGFLPVNDSTGKGTMFLAYSVAAKTGLADNTQISAQATITLDGSSANTNTFVNTIDATPPTSTVTALPATEKKPNFQVAWSGSDTGSGIASYDIYVSNDGGGYTLWLADTTRTSATFKGQAGHSYTFYSVATDNAGNRQPIPTAAQTSTTVV